ncbi:MAG TPA: hypothetical protein VE862_08960 [Candidatus Acidoferrum sp.]|nr:hypothetical protein [Candidatus Acidoferrum sp.]
MNLLKEQGSRQVVWLSNDLFALTETVRVQLGLSKSGFYRYCILRTLDSMDVLSAKAKRSFLEGT